ncbi:MAG: DUF4003 family protein [Clostridia bacterium]|nr:DUF4003 family protein [Clostridia bacterium]
MKQELMFKLDKMAENYEILRKSFQWDNDTSKHLVALQYALEEQMADVDRIQQLKNQIKEETGAFSPLRGVSMFTICGLLSATQLSPSQKLSEMIQLLDDMKDIGFKQGTYLPYALYTLVTVKGEQPVSSLMEKGLDLYTSMKKNHPFLTSGDDYALAILLAASSQDIDKIETYYNKLVNAKFYKSNELQLLSHIMAFHDGDVDVQIQRLKQIVEVLKANKIKPSTSGYAALGLLTFMEESSEFLNDFIEIVLNLKKRKHYKWLDKNILMLLASGILAKELAGDSILQTTLQASIQSIIAAQQVAMMTVTASAAVTT